MNSILSQVKLRLNMNIKCITTAVILNIMIIINIFDNCRYKLQR